MPLLKNLAMLVVVIGVFFLAGEITCRYLGFPGAIYDYDPSTGLGIFIPNNDFRHIGSCYDNRVTTNSVGFHEREFSVAKAPEVYRIAVIGDSFVQAMEVPLDKTFHKLLAAKLKASAPPGRRFEVYAFGRSGNGSALNYLYLKNLVAPYRPDLVIHLFFPFNDFRDDSRELTEEYVWQTGDTDIYSGHVYPVPDDDGDFTLWALDDELRRRKESRAPRPWYARLARSSSFLAWLKSRFQTAKHAVTVLWQGQIPHHGVNVSAVDDEVFLKEPPERWQRALAIEKRLIRGIAEATASLGADYLLVSVADAYRVEEMYRSSPTWNPATMSLDRPEEILDGIAHELSVDYLPLWPSFRERWSARKTPISFPCDRHWNETGHAWAAEVIGEWVGQIK